MHICNNVSVYDISWLNHIKGGTIGTFYEPESISELKEICSLLYQKNKHFDLIGHTSNIYFMPEYSVDYMVSTRKCNSFVEYDNEIVCDCGASVMKLARRMVDKGIKGFEGLIDLPGTVGASIYGNASCYGCSVNNLLISCELLQPNGEVMTIYPKDLQLSKRSSTLKRGELGGVILSARLRREKGNVEEIKNQAKMNHKTRKLKQSGPKDNLGSIYAESGGWTSFSFIPRIIVKLYGWALSVCGKSNEIIERKKKELFFHLLGADELLPYVYNWNRYIWKDEQAHTLFWKFHQLHQKMFKESRFEIEIKG